MIPQPLVFGDEGRRLRSVLRPLGVVREYAFLPVILSPQAHHLVLWAWQITGQLCVAAFLRTMPGVRAILEMGCRWVRSVGMERGW